MFTIFGLCCFVGCDFRHFVLFTASIATVWLVAEIFRDLISRSSAWKWLIGPLISVADTSFWQSMTMQLSPLSRDTIFKEGHRGGGSWNVLNYILKVPLNHWLQFGSLWGCYEMGIGFGSTKPMNTRCLFIFLEKYHLSTRSCTWQCFVFCLLLVLCM